MGTDGQKLLQAIDNAVEQPLLQELRGQPKPEANF